MKKPWHLESSGDASVTHDASGLPSVCPKTGAPWLVRYSGLPSANTKAKLEDRPWNMWRYREFMPLVPGEEPISLGEGMTPLLRMPLLEQQLGIDTVFVKDEGQNPCGSFKARGLSAAVTRAVAGAAKAFTIPTAGNAGVALAAYGKRAGIPVRVFAPETTPTTILNQMKAFGADLQLLSGHIGDCGTAAKAFASESGAVDVSTLREPYRIEGKKTLGLELAEQLGWTLPDVVLYPTGGGTGLIGMWKAFDELRRAGWINAKSPRLISVQAVGCAPVVEAFDSGATTTNAWPNPTTIAAGLRVPAPLGGPLMLRAIRETGGCAIAVTDEALEHARVTQTQATGIDLCPEGGATVAALGELVEQGIVSKTDRVVLFNTGAGWLYR